MWSLSLRNPVLQRFNMTSGNTEPANASHSSPHSPSGTSSLPFSGAPMPLQPLTGVTIDPSSQSGTNVHLTQYASPAQSHPPQQPPSSTDNALPPAYSRGDHPLPPPAAHVHSANNSSTTNLNDNNNALNHETSVTPSSTTNDDHLRTQPNNPPTNTNINPLNEDDLDLAAPPPPYTPSRPARVLARLGHDRGQSYQSSTAARDLSDEALMDLYKSQRKRRKWYGLAVVMGLGVVLSIVVTQLAHGFLSKN